MERITSGASGQGRQAEPDPSLSPLRIQHRCGHCQQRIALTVDVRIYTDDDGAIRCEVAEEALARAIRVHLRSCAADCGCGD